MSDFVSSQTLDAMLSEAKPFQGVYDMYFFLRSSVNITVSSTDTTVNKKYVICVDYMPLTLWINNVEYFCVLNGYLEKGSCPIYRVIFVNKYRSEAFQQGILRKHMYNYSGLQKAIEILTAMLSPENVSNQDIFERGLNHLATLKLTQINGDELGRLISSADDQTNEIRTFSCEDNSYVDAINEAVVTLNSVIQKAKNKDYVIDRTIISGCLSNLERAVPALFSRDTIGDLLAYIQHFYYGFDVVSQDVSNIFEVSSLNIITNFYTALKNLRDTDGNFSFYHQYMYAANYELLHLYSCGFSGNNIIRDETLRSFSYLTEFVPIAMQFRGVYNPLFDTSFKLMHILSNNIRMFKNSEKCRNICNFSGNTVRYLAEDLSGRGLPCEDEAQSTIVMGLCCDISEIFSKIGIAISPNIEPHRLVYSSDMCAALLYVFLAQQSAIGGISFDTFPFSSNTELERLFKHSDALSHSDTLSISFAPRLSTTSAVEDLKIGWDYVYKWFLRTAFSYVYSVTPSKPKTVFPSKNVYAVWQRFFPKQPDYNFIELITNISAAGISIDNI